MEEKKIKTSRRFRYVDNYRMTRRTREDGTVTEEAEYVGNYLLAEHPEQVYRSVRRLAAASSVLSLLAAVLLLAVKGFAVYGGGLYALVPAAAALFPGIYLLLGAMKLPPDDRKLQEDVYRFGHARIRKSAHGVLFLYSATLFLSLVFFVTSGVSPGALDILYFILAVFPAAAGRILLWNMDKLKYHSSGQA